MVSTALVTTLPAQRDQERPERPGARVPIPPRSWAARFPTESHAAQRRGPYLLDLQLRVRLLAAQQFHGKAGLGQQHSVPVPAITRVLQLVTGSGD